MTIKRKLFETKKKINNNNEKNVFNDHKSSARTVTM